MKIEHLTGKVLQRAEMANNTANCDMYVVFSFLTRTAALVFTHNEREKKNSYTSLTKKMSEGYNMTKLPRVRNMPV